MTYAAEHLHEQAAYLAFHLHWPLPDILDLEHADRQRYLAETAALVARAHDGS
ncbi:DUF6760 family protein [Frankia sp. AgKG'84/4]|uniref:DUF6760 family protein n=1 Tax=Frankia sp. AgKG'84/4 TaxID=573490 RepID=UPI00200E70C8|nr:DUF6760 family protein [Frankia sp. AgKG'84/4]MCL9796092.1 hypothetical protein [Frankia sp. AgKG'84/4]